MADGVSGQPHSGLWQPPMKSTGGLAGGAGSAGGSGDVGGSGDKSGGGGGLGGAGGGGGATRPTQKKAPQSTWHVEASWQ